MPAPFIYFDLGNVLLYFSHDRMCQQMAQVLATDAERVRAFLFEGDRIQIQLESGQLSGEEFYQLLCETFGRKPPREELFQAASDIFTLNLSMMPVLAHLSRVGCRLGLLSNIGPWHWQWVLQKRYSLIPSIFQCVVLSYEVQAMKPLDRIFQHATELSHVPADEILYFDDILGHVEAANTLGWHAAQYLETPGLVKSLRQRGVEFGY